MKFLKCKLDQIPPKTGKKVAIIGAGPAGLNAAAVLICKGHEVHVFDKLPEPGGLLIFGIPAWRMDKKLIRKGIKELADAGVVFHTNTTVDTEMFEKMLNEYDGIVIASGAWKSKFPKIPGIELEGVIDALTYLVKEGLARDGYIPKEERFVPVGKTAVIGCGETAMDACRQAVRDGAEEVYVIYRRSKEQAPSKDAEIKAAEKEGVEFIWLTNPTKLIGNEKGRVCKIELIKMKLGEPDESGRPRPIPIPGSEYTMDMDTVIFAVGMYATPPFHDSKFGIELTSWGTIKTDKEGRTTRPGVCAAGDVVTGPYLIGPAIISGKKAAESLDEYLRTNKWEFKEN